jgi:AraC-like DNA-binding protein
MAACGEQPYFLRRSVPPDLAGLVTDLVGYQEDGEPMRLSPEMAPLVVPLVISFSDPFEIAFSRNPTPEDRYASFTSGLYPGFVLINSTGRAQCVQIDFTPLGAYRFFRLPMSEIASRMVTLEDLGDPGISELRDRLAAMNDWDQRLDAVEDFARGRLLGAGTHHAGVAWAYDQILKQSGKTRISDLAATLEWSRKHLNQRFHELIGVGPKTVARMVRFNRAMAIAKTHEGSGWADIAFAAGYADQAHLTREFREFAGVTPARLPRTGDAVTFVQARSLRSGLDLS